MRCPRCGRQAISFLKFGLRDWPRIKCAECGTPLRQSRRHRTVAYAYLGFALLLFASLVVFINVLAWTDEEAFGLVFALIILVGLPCSYVMWKYGEWVLDEQKKGDEEPQPPDGSDAATPSEGEGRETE